MSRLSEIGLGLLLIGMLVAIYAFLGPRVCAFAAGLSVIWFLIIIVLASRPPGIPELVSEEIGQDEQHVVRKDVLPLLSWPNRLRLALGAACGSCLILWLSLVLLAK